MSFKFSITAIGLSYDIANWNSRNPCETVECFEKKKRNNLETVKQSGKCETFEQQPRF